MKQYIFTEEELTLLREATREYGFMLKEHNTLSGHATEKRTRNINVVHSLFEQFRDDLICSKG